MNDTNNPALNIPRRISSSRIITDLLFSLLLLSYPVCAESGVEVPIQALLSNLPNVGTSASACVFDFASDEMVFADHADEPLIPASTMKLFTMAAALIHLGPDFHFETTVYTDGNHLYVIGDGDPALGDEKLYKKRNESIDTTLRQWANTLLQAGISIFPGQLIIDESIFDQQFVHPAWDKDDLNSWYAAPVGGLNFNDNCVNITIRPDDKQGQPVWLSIQPDTTLVHIINHCKSGGRGTPLIHHVFDTMEYRISGRCSKRWRFSPVSFPNPGMLFADVFRTVLAKKGVTFHGNIARRRVRKSDGSLPESLIPIARHQTSISDVLYRTGKNSQNLFAECLMKRAGYSRSKRNGEKPPQGSWETGQQAVVDMVTRVGIGTEGFVVADGSGLSRANRCTARQLVSLLAWVQTQTWKRLLHDSLSIAGVDGSLRRRLTEQPGRVYAKTGTMRSVSALAGYVDQEDGTPRYAFVVLFNGYQGSSTPYKDIQDQICRILIQHSSDTDVSNP